VYVLNKKKGLKSVAKRPSLSYVVMENIKQAILDGTIKPGDLLPSEAEMSEQMGVGKSSVREAIKMLSAMGVIESIQGEGTYVRSKVDDQGINPMVYQLVLMQGSNEQIFQLREMLEPAYTQLAMEQASPDDIEKIVNTVDELERKVALGTQTAQDDLAFHEAVLHATHNPFVIKIGMTSMHLFEASINNSMLSIPGQAVYDHRRIMDAMLQKDKDILREAVLMSFEGWKKTLRSMNG
jgi:GntR family transcriptional regulator, transcriptional repressor for pyruvate dehydrogenase complex